MPFLTNTPKGPEHEVCPSLLARVPLNPKLKAPLKIRAFSGDPSMQIIPTLGPKVCKSYLHWAIRIPRVWQII